MWKKISKDLVKAFNTGVSYFMPAVVIGGVFLAISLATGTAGENGMEVTNPFFQSLGKIGEAGFAIMIPVLAGYIAYSLAGKPALIPGMVAGYVANNPVGPNNVSTGFIGAMILGVLTGYFVKWMKTWNVGKTLGTVMPILIIPIISSLVLNLAYIYVLATPLGWAMTQLTNALSNLSGTSAIITGLIIGFMAAIDMGGPFSKAATAFTLVLMDQGIYGPNGAFRIAVAVPPLILGVSTLIDRKKYSAEEKQLGITAIFMGLIGITEGAIPFAVKDFKRVMPSIIIGTMVAGALGMVHGVECLVPHGGMIVIGAVTGKMWFVVDMLIGVAVGVIILHFLKPNVEEELAK